MKVGDKIEATLRVPENGKKGEGRAVHLALPLPRRGGEGGAVVLVVMTLSSF